MKEQTLEQMKRELAELKAKNEQLVKKLEEMGNDPFFKRTELREGVYGEMSADEFGNWTPTIEYRTQGMKIRISGENSYPTKTKAVYALSEMDSEYGELCEGTIKAYLSPETLPNSHVAQPFQNILNSAGK